jgi:glutathione synthase/RimK-type ligase-like ATP-grasp enzyme
MKVQLLCTKNGLKSGSLRAIAEALGKDFGYKVWRTTDVRQDRKQFRYGDVRDKLFQYKWFEQQGLSALEFTTDKQQAHSWQQAGHTVVGRQTLTGSCGQGIVLFEPYNEEGLEPNGQAHGCKVYTKYKKKKREFRVHVFKDKVVCILEKRKKTNWTGKNNPKIRNLDNGYVFCQEVELTAALQKRLEEVSLKAAKVNNSDFSGVDVGFNEHNNDVFILEVNSAPGIEGMNVSKYVDVIKTFV